jgi:hypothetical protein
MKDPDLAEIARLRGSAEGAVEAHPDAIDRKADDSVRPALMPRLVKDLMTELPQDHTGKDLSIR